MAKYRRPVLTPGEQIERIVLPKGEEMFAIVEQRLGFNKMYVRCIDNKIRLGRIPGKYSRRLWIREGDLVLVTLWPVQADKKCDIINKYTNAQWDWLVRNKKVPQEFR